MAWATVAKSGTATISRAKLFICVLTGDAPFLPLYLEEYCAKKCVILACLDILCEYQLHFSYKVNWCILWKVDMMTE